jgi:cytochrome c-type biogenesis protein CcmH
MRFSPVAMIRRDMIIVLIMLFLTLPTYAQDAVSTPEVSADAVNAIARKMYCPVCENIPLDVCPTAACAQWRDQIKAELEAGQSEDQIIAGFVARYGDRVIGTPQDPTLRALSLVTPWLIALVVVAVALWLFLRWWRGRAESVPSNMAAGTPVSLSDEEYRARLERDLQTRR